MNDNVIQIDTIRIDRGRQRKCTCEVRKFTIDTVNREITCGCGLAVDPFEAIVYLGKHYEDINRQHDSLNEQRKQWIKEKPYSVLFKELERNYRRGEMLPHCPECNAMIDFKDMTFFSNAMFYKRRKGKGEQR